MKKIIAAGFLVRSGEKYLLGLPTGHKHWSIFKGEIEKDESPLETAIRELKEETGIDLKKDTVLLTNIYPIPVCTYEIAKKNKTVIVYYLNDTAEHLYKNYKFKCTSTFMGDNKTFPEIKDFKWFTFDELKENILPSQRPLLTIIEKLK